MIPAQCLNCGVLFGPGFFALALIIGGVSTRIMDWRDLKDRTNLIAAVGMVVLAFSIVWMYIDIFEYEEIEYLRLFAPSLIGLGVTIVGVFGMRRDINFSGHDYAYTGIALFFGSLGWILWVFQAFS